MGMPAHAGWWAQPEMLKTWTDCASPSRASQSGVLPWCRDLKPENFLLADQSDRAELKATDFGLSAFFRPGQVFSEILGSAYYIAPEVRLNFLEQQAAP